MRKIIIAAALVSFTAIPAFAGGSNAISVNSGMNTSMNKPTTGNNTQVSQPSKPSKPSTPPSRPSIPSPPSPPSPPTR